MNINPWPNVKGGPPIVLGAGTSDRWIGRAAKEYDGWMASAFSGFAFLRDNAQRYRDLGGTGRLICAIVSVDLRAPYQPLDEAGRFTLQCPPEEAAARLQRIADCGYDTIVVTRLDYSDEDWPEADLAELRSLLPQGEQLNDTARLHDCTIAANILVQRAFPTWAQTRQTEAVH